jgi:hypothetical protein
MQLNAMAGKKSAATREAVALALAQGETIAEAGAGAGVAERTVHLWLKDPGFRARIDELRAAVLERTMAMLVSGTTRAAARLRRLVRSRDEKVALRASVALLEQAARLRELTTIEQRVRALEARSDREANYGNGNRVNGRIT